MIIEAVELENFLSHRYTKVELGRGIVAVVGPNGAGKTSIVDAITYALFNIHSRDTRNKKEPLIRLGAPAAKIIVEFSVGKKRYRVHKTVYRGATPTQATLYLLEDGKPRLVARGVESVSREIARIVGFDPQLADVIMVTRQGEIEKILVDKKARIEAINTLLKLRAMEKTYDRMRDLISRVSRRLEYYRGRHIELERELKRLREEAARYEEARRELERVSAELEEVRRKLDEAKHELERVEELRREYEDLNYRLGLLEAAIKRDKERLAELEREYREARAAEEELEALRGALEVARKVREVRQLLVKRRQLEAHLEAIEKGLENFEADEDMLRNLEEVVRRYEELEEKLRELEDVNREYMIVEKQLENIEKDIRRVEEERDKARSKLYALLQSSLPVEPPSEVSKLLEFIDSLVHDIDKRIEQLRARKEAVVGQVSAKLNEKEYIEGILLKLTSASGRCPLCGRPLTEEHRMTLISKFRSEKRGVETEIKRLEAQKQTIEAEITRLEQQRERIRELGKKIRELVSQVSQLEARLEELRTEQAKLSERRLELFEKHKEYEEARKELEKLGQAVVEYRVLKRRLEELEKRRVEAERLREELRRLDEKIGTLLGELGVDASGLDELEERVSHLLEMVAELRSKASRRPELERRLDEVRRRLEDYEEEYNSVAGRLEELKGIEEEYEKLRSLVESLEERYREKVAEYSKLRGIVDELEKSVKRLKLVEEEYRRVSEKLERYSHAKRALERIRAVIGPEGLQRIVRQAIRNSLEYHLRQILSAFNIDFVDVKLDDEYSVTLITRAGEKTVSMLSGGEKIALAIAYRLALARLVGSRIESLIMDEPTVHLDAEKRRELVNIIKQSLSVTGLAQMIVVTHDREVEDVADRVIEV
ncbi:AAA family ATPase [Hyperthermus butylicus]|uniref:DNA double-strand break repair Rad50 ATPase n=1 Tax=Hyperthermus butylicus (strain DSM 5456 / JCM 9403 / PLM1-5) TaxID=415426 RepID=A2BM16_HYPBU|nr:AAA family ATPase [Hyperthermus butylicus]ABM81027.1 putative Rad50 [Hyperthermus butylicus DSM 5456]